MWFPGFVLGFILGFVLSSPFGPIGLICLRRTLTQGKSAGLVSALGISLAYGFWAYAVIHGLTRVSHWIDEEKAILEGCIGLFFLLYGFHGMFNTPSTEYPTLRRRGKAANFFSTFFVVFLNPGTGIMFAVLFTLFGMTRQHHGLFYSLETALSVFIGSFSFWLVLSGVLGKLKERVNNRGYGRISRLSCWMVSLFGIAILLLSMGDILSAV